MTRESGVSFEDVHVGMTLKGDTKGPLTTTHLMRWSAAIENWHKIHYDRTFAMEHDGLPDLVVQGSLKQHFIVEALEKWAGLKGWVWRIGYSFRALNPVGCTLQAWGEVVAVQKSSQWGWVKLRLGLTDHEGRESTPGWAIVALPYQDGPALPYPFVTTAVPVFDDRAQPPSHGA